MRHLDSSTVFTREYQERAHGECVVCGKKSGRGTMCVRGRVVEGKCISCQGKREKRMRRKNGKEGRNIEGGCVCVGGGCYSLVFAVQHPYLAHQNSN